MAGFSASTGYRLEKDPRLPSQKKGERRHSGGKSALLEGIWEPEVLRMLENAPRLRAVTIFHELCRRYPDRDIWLFLCDNGLSNRVFASYSQIVDLFCHAWSNLIEQPWKIMPIGMRQWAHGL